MALHDDELLLATRAHRDDHPPAVAELLAEGVGDRGRGGRDDDRVERREIRRTERPVTGAELDPIRIAELCEPTAALAARSGSRSMDVTWQPSSARIAAW